MSEYEGREQSLVKHVILRKYLERFAHIVGSWSPAIAYVDCFSGPWNVQSQDLHDSSFAIALEELRRARSTLTTRGRQIRLRCYFLERDRRAYAALHEYAERQEDIEIRTRNAALEESVPDILRFLDAGGADSFPFVLIDPTGWSGYPLEVISPLLKRKPGEVLVNFMTSFIRRFIKSPDPATQVSFDRMFGRFRPSMEHLAGLSEEDLDDTLVAAYTNLLRQTGDYTYVCSAVVLRPEINSTHFRLIYATRSLRGVEVFKEAERKAMEVQEDARAQAKTRRMEQENLLLWPDAMADPRHFGFLVARYRTLAKAAVVEALHARQTVSYDSLYASALSYPIVQETDLRGWLDDWSRRGCIELLGLKPRQRVPHIGERVSAQLRNPSLL